jgi:hypothetical protein
VLQVSDGIACIYGFNEVMAGEFDKIWRGYTRHW